MTNQTLTISITGRSITVHSAAEIPAALEQLKASHKTLIQRVRDLFFEIINH